MLCLSRLPVAAEEEDRERSPTAEELSRLETEISRLEEDANAWDIDRTQMLEQLMVQQREKSDLEMELRETAARADALEAVLEELHAIREQEEQEAAAEGGLGAGGAVPAAAAAEWEAERLRFADKLEEAAARELEFFRGSLGGGEGRGGEGRSSLSSSRLRMRRCRARAVPATTRGRRRGLPGRCRAPREMTALFPGAASKNIRSPLVRRGLSFCSLLE